LLLDEPFSNLDATLRLQTRGEVKRLIDRFGLTTIFVTHDQNEAVAMGHRVAVMRQGQIEQVGTYQEIYREPVNTFVAGFLGNPPMHLVAGRCVGDDIVCEVSGTQVRLPLPVHYRPRVADREPITIGLRPEHLRLTSAGETPGLPCTVEMVEMSVSDAAHVLHLRHNDHTFCAKVALQQPVRPRETVWLHFPPQHLYYFDRDDKRL
jgi:ABC-type sugar transport system ATPase subunit